MRARNAAVVLAAVGAAETGLGQVQNTEIHVAFSLGWQEAHVGPSGTFRDGAPGNLAGGIPGVLEPGEGVLFTINARMNLPGGALATAAVGGAGTPMHWAPTILTGSSGTGTLCGFWGAELKLSGSAGGQPATGTWSDGTTAYAAAVRRKLITFTAGNGIGIVGQSGSVMDRVGPAQFGPNAEALSQANDIVCWQGLWVPPVSARTYTWTLDNGSLALATAVFARDSRYDEGYTLPVPLSVPVSYGSPLTFTSIPTPGVGAMMGVGLLGWARRKRRRDQIA